MASSTEAGALAFNAANLNFAPQTSTRAPRGWERVPTKTKSTSRATSITQSQKAKERTLWKRPEKKQFKYETLHGGAGFNVQGSKRQRTQKIPSHVPVKTARGPDREEEAEATDDELFSRRRKSGRRSSIRPIQKTESPPKARRISMPRAKRKSEALQLSPVRNIRVMELSGSPQADRKARKSLRTLLGDGTPMRNTFKSPQKPQHPLQEVPMFQPQIQSPSPSKEPALKPTLSDSLAKPAQSPVRQSPQKAAPQWRRISPQKSPQRATPQKSVFLQKALSIQKSSPRKPISPANASPLQLLSKTLSPQKVFGAQPDIAFHLSPSIFSKNLVNTMAATPAPIEPDFTKQRRRSARLSGQGAELDPEPATTATNPPMSESTTAETVTVASTSEPRRRSARFSGQGLQSEPVVPAIEVPADKPTFGKPSFEVPADSDEESELEQPSEPMCNEEELSSADTSPAEDGTTDMALDEPKTETVYEPKEESPVDDLTPVAIVPVVASINPEHHESDNETIVVATSPRKRRKNRAVAADSAMMATPRAESFKVEPQPAQESPEQQLAQELADTIKEAEMKLEDESMEEIDYKTLSPEENIKEEQDVVFDEAIQVASPHAVMQDAPVFEHDDAENAADSEDELTARLDCWTDPAGVREERSRNAPRFSDDTTILKDFLNRAQAKRAAQAAAASTGSPRKKSPTKRSPKKATLASPRRSPRRALETVDGNSPSPSKPELKPHADTPPSKGTVVLSFDADESDELASPVKTTRRSARSKLPGSSKPGPSLIPLRRPDGQDPPRLRKTEAQELAIVTRTNTRRNKGTARMPPERLVDLSAREPSPIKERPTLNGRKAVDWNAELVSYLGDTTAAKPKKTRAKRSQGLGTVNGTPAKQRTIARPESSLPAPAPSVTVTAARQRPRRDAN